MNDPEKVVNNQWDINAFRSFVEAMLSQWHIPGVAIAVVTKDQVLLCDGFGSRTLEQGLSVTSETVFPIASCTKAFTAMTIGLLVDAGQLNWDEPIKLTA